MLDETLGVECPPGRPRCVAGTPSGVAASLIQALATVA
jgi:hypothetical protein